MHLNRAGLTVAEKGATGGTRLARDAHDITLLDVYTALDDATGTFRLHAHPNAFCPVGRTIKAALEPRLDAAEAKLRAELAKTTIADLSADVLAASGGHAQAC